MSQFKIFFSDIKLLWIVSCFFWLFSLLFFFLFLKSQKYSIFLVKNKHKLLTNFNFFLQEKYLLFPNQLKCFPRGDLPWDAVRYWWELFSIPDTVIQKNPTYWQTRESANKIDRNHLWLDNMKARDENKKSKVSCQVTGRLDELVYRERWRKLGMIRLSKWKWIVKGIIDYMYW